MSRARQRTLMLVAALLLVPVFWLAAQAGSLDPGLLAVAINVHGLPVPGYSGTSTGALAPLSVRIITDAIRDASTGRPPASPKPQPTPSGTPDQPAPGLPGPTPSATLPQPSASGTLPLPTPSTTIVPTPSTAPLPSAPVVPSLPLPTL